MKDKIEEILMDYGDCPPMVSAHITSELLTLIANHDAQMLAKIEGLVDKEITSKDLSKIIHLDDIKSLYGGKDEDNQN